MFSYTKEMFDQDCESISSFCRAKRPKYIHGVPRGGLLPALAVSMHSGIPLRTDYFGMSTEDRSRTIVIDDVVDSGATKKRYSEAMAFISLFGYDFGDSPHMSCRQKPSEWVEFWWEANESPAQDAIVRMIQVIGDDPTREGLIETPKRVLKSFKELFSGYSSDEDSIKSILKTFTEGACDDMVITRDIEIFSTCEHHMLPFFGKCHIGYIPNGRVVGVSKLVRLMEIYARRLQIQERIGDQITDALMNYLGAKGAACVIEAQHLCMKARGVEKQHSVMITSSMKGVFREHSATRSEFMSLIRG